jgi:hypothetical protein
MQFASQFLSGPVQPGLNGALAHAQVLGHLPIRPILRVLQQQDFSIASWQLSERLSHHRLSLIGEQPVERVALARVAFRGFGSIGISLDQFPPPALATPILQRANDHQPIQPCPDAFRVAKLVAFLHGGGSHVLHDVVGRRGVADSR